MRYSRCLAFWFLAFAALMAHAEGFPNKPVKIYVTSVAGGGLDSFTRAIADDLSRLWKQPVIVDNRTGGGGIVAARAAIQSAPDGYTLFALSDNVLVHNRFSYRNLQYDPDKSFTPISLMARSDQLVVVNKQLPVRSLKELVSYAKQKPGSLSYGQWGLGSSPQLLFETLNKAEGIDLMSVPYKGVAPVMTAVTANEVQLTVVSPMTGSALLSSGAVRPLAIAGSKRSAAYPDLPTTAEQGYPSLRAYIWYGMVAPAGLPPQIAAKLQRDVQSVLKDPTFFDRHTTLRGWDIVASTGQELARTVKQEVPVVGAMMKAANVQPQ